LLGKLALRDIHRHPGLRGESLAQIADLIGWLGTLFAIVLVGLAAAVQYFGFPAV
jgi:hypothetical protein